MAQLRALAVRVQDLNPVLLEDGYDTELVMKFDDFSSVSATVHEGAFSFGVSIEFDTFGNGVADSFGHVAMEDLASAEEEVRSNFRDMPRLKAEALEDFNGSDDA